MIKVKEAKALPGYRLLVTFNTGEQKVFNMVKMLKYPVYEKLKDENVFSNFAIRRGVITWDNGNIDVAPDYMYYRPEISDKQIKKAWDKFDEIMGDEPGFGIIPWDGPRYRLRAVIERQEQLGRFLTEEELREFEIKDVQERH